MKWDWAGKRLLVVGDVMLDVYEQAGSVRLASEGPTLHVRDRRCLPGGAAWAAWIADALGAEVTLVGLVGSDSEGSELMNQVRHLAEPRIVCDLRRPTTTKTRTAWDGVGFVRRDQESTAAAEGRIADHLVHAMRERIAAPFDAVLLSDYGKGVFADAAVRAAAMAHQNVVLDPKHTLRAFAGVRHATPNEVELRSLLCGDSELQAPSYLGGGANVIVTLGDAGARIVTDDYVQTIPTHPAELWDGTVGAGDAFAVGYALALAAGNDVCPAVEAANATARLLVSIPRGERPHLEQVKSHYDIIQEATCR